LKDFARKIEKIRYSIRLQKFVVFAIKLNFFYVLDVFMSLNYSVGSLPRSLVSTASYHCRWNWETYTVCWVSVGFMVKV